MIERTPDKEWPILASNAREIHESALREREAPNNVPWCCMVTETMQPSASRCKSSPAKQGLQEKIASHHWHPQVTNNPLDYESIRSSCVILMSIESSQSIA